MADKNNSADAPRYESQESLYEKAVKKMNADKLIVQFAYKIDNYQQAAVMFEEVGDYLDAVELAKKCRRLAGETKEEQKRSQYQSALEQREKCVTVKDYEKLSERFESLGDYEDASGEGQRCREKISEINKKGKVRRTCVCVAVVAFAGLILAGVYVGFFSYVKGLFYNIAGQYGTAKTIFEDLGTFLDSENRVEQCEEKMLQKAAAEEKAALIKAKAGSEFSFGNHTWKVLERDGDYVYMIATQVNKESEFYHVPFHNEQEAVTWENSSLRQWLNTDVLENCFTDDERALLVQMDTESEDNKQYGTDGGAAVKDYVRILSVEEAEKYKDILDTLGLDYWLRTPGNQPDTAVFISAGHSIMEYGYPVSSEELSVRPVIMVDCSGIKEEEAL